MQERNLVKKILEVCSEGRNLLSTQWSFQGLGMYRLYLDSAHKVRLHVWFPSKCTYASEIHTHPWDFKSTVINGVITDHLYKEEKSSKSKPYNRQKLFCGIGGGLQEQPEVVELRNIYEPYVIALGQSYVRRRNHIHRSEPKEGTVTIVERSIPEGMSPDHAFVYWPVGKEWGNAEPRLATSEEVNEVCQNALSLWED